MGPGPGFDFTAVPPPEPGAPHNLADDPFWRFRRAIFVDETGRVVRPTDLAGPFDPVGLVAAQRGARSYSIVRENGERVRVLSVPWAGRPGGVVQVAREMREVDGVVRSLLLTFLWLFPVVLVVSGGGALFLTNRALRPVADVAQAAAGIQASDLSRRLEVRGDDELADLQRTFNAMIARLETSFGDLERAVENQRRFTADASHELRTPLTRLRLATSAAMERPDDPEVLRQALRTAEAAGQAMSRLVQQLLTLSRADAGQLGLERVPLDLRLVVAEALDATPGGESVDVHLPEADVWVEGDADHLRRVVVNLLENALRASPEAGTVSVRIETVGVEARIAVSDRGPGIDPAHLPHLGERFYRVDTARSRADGGGGLGLAICRSILAAHGGRLEIQSVFGEGATFFAVLPILTKASRATSIVEP